MISQHAAGGGILDLAQPFKVGSTFNDGCVGWWIARNFGHAKSINGLGARAYDISPGQYHAKMYLTSAAKDEIRFRTDGREGFGCWQFWNTSNGAEIRSDAGSTEHPLIDASSVTQLTILCRFRIRTLTDNHGLFAIGSNSSLNRIYFYIDSSDDNVYLGSKNGGTFTYRAGEPVNGGFETYKWYTCAATYDSSRSSSDQIRHIGPSGRLNEQSQVGSGGFSTTLATKIMIGNGAGGGFDIAGSIAEVKIFDYAMPDDFAAEMVRQCQRGWPNDLGWIRSTTRSIGTGTAPVDLTIQSADVAVTADNLALTQDYNLTVAGADVAVDAENVALTQGYVLTVQGADVAVAADNLALTQVYNLTVAGADIGVTADNLALTTGNELVIASADVAVDADALDLAQVYSLTVASADATVAADNVGLVTQENLAIDSATIVVGTDNLNLSDGTVNPSEFFTVQTNSTVFTAAEDSAVFMVRRTGNMQTPVHTTQTRYKHYQGDRDYIVDVSDALDGATVSSVSGDDGNGQTLGATVAKPGLIIENVSINSAGDVTKHGHTTPQNKGIQFTARNGRRDELHEVTILYRTSDGQTLGVICPIKCVG